MIPFVDLKTQYLSIKDEVNAAIQGVLESCQFTLGSEVAKFEEEFAAYSGAKIGIGVNTGTSALHLALLAAGVGPDRKSTRLNSSHATLSRMPSSA